MEPLPKFMWESMKWDLKKMLICVFKWELQQRSTKWVWFWRVCVKRYKDVFFNISTFHRLLNALYQSMKRALGKGNFCVELEHKDVKESLGTQVGINQSSLHLQLRFEYLPEMRQAVCYAHLNISKSFLYFQAIFAFKKERIPERILQVQEFFWGERVLWVKGILAVSLLLWRVWTPCSERWTPEKRLKWAEGFDTLGKKNGFSPFWWSRDFTNDLKFSESILGAEHNSTGIDAGRWSHSGFSLHAWSNQIKELS